MLNPWLVLATIAFFGSFSVSLLMTRDFGASLVAGSSALVTAFATTAAVNWYRNQSTDQRLLAMRQQIRALQRQRAAEEQTIFDLSAEKDRVMVSLQSMQETLRQRQLPSANPYAPPAVSWNLAAVPSSETLQAAIAETTAEIQPEFQPASLTQFISEAAATKQKITASLNQLQGELHQVNAQVGDQRQVRDQLIQDVQHLKQQKHHLDITAKTLTQEVQELERCRQELDEYVVYLETKKQELETGANPLQKALKHLQSQVAALQDELRSLESQVTAKRLEKEALQQEQEQAIALQQRLPQLHQEIAALEANLAHLRQQQGSNQTYQPDTRQLLAQKAQLEREVSDLKQLQAQKLQLEQELSHLKQLQAQKSQLEREVISLKQLESQKSQLEREVSRLKQLESQKSQLEREISDLKQLESQKSQLEREVSRLKQLESQKSQLEQEVSSLKQQQTQLKATQDSLQKIEKQIRDRRQEKESLEKQITQLQAQKTAVRHQPNSAAAPTAQPLEFSVKDGNTERNGTSKPVLERPMTRPKPAPIEAEPWDEETSQQELSDLWTDFMVQLPEYELQALKAIAHDSNPIRVLNRIAEDNFTTSVELIDSINQLAEEMVGERVIKSRGSAPPIIIKDHQRTIKKLIETYEYLTE